MENKNTYPCASVFIVANLKVRLLYERGAESYRQFGFFPSGALHFGGFAGGADQEFP
jgi:hypothetical protein